MTLAIAEITGYKQILEQKESELAQMLRRRDGIAIEKSADQMDEIQFASERELAIRNVDRDSMLLRDVKAGIRRIHAGNFGVCMECEEEISPRRLLALPWAPRCIQCQEIFDRNGQEEPEARELLVDAA